MLYHWHCADSLTDHSGFCSGSGGKRSDNVRCPTVIVSSGIKTLVVVQGKPALALQLHFAWPKNDSRSRA